MSFTKNIPLQQSSLFNWYLHQNVHIKRRSLKTCNFKETWKFPSIPSHCWASASKITACDSHRKKQILRNMQVFFALEVKTVVLLEKSYCFITEAHFNNFLTLKWISKHMDRGLEIGCTYPILRKYFSKNNRRQTALVLCKFPQGIWKPVQTW